MFSNINQQGIFKCLNYAFPPNSLKYCGPNDKTRELLEYAKIKKADLGLAELIKKFEILYPYLQLIAHENNIVDPFDEKVVEGYWIGNEFLENITIKNFYTHLIEKQNITKKVSKKEFNWLMKKIPIGGLPHHTFHVLNIFKGVQNKSAENILNTMDSCRISVGKVIELEPQIGVMVKPLHVINNKLCLGKPVKKNIISPIAEKKNIQLGCYVSIHWNAFCEVLSQEQVKNLNKYTKLAIDLANTTI